MNVEEWRRAGAYVDHNGHRAFYREEGRGDVILCIHGFPTASWDWHRVWPTLTREHRLIAPDMMGFGFSAKPARYDYSIFDQADLHERLLASLGVERCHVLAHDYGDTVAQELLARYLERQAVPPAKPELASICFLNGGLFPEAHRARRIQNLLATPILGWLLARLTTRSRFEEGFRAIFGPDTQPSAEEMDAFWRLVSHEHGFRRTHQLIGYMQERRTNRERWVGALQSSTIPLRVIDGPADPVSGRHMAERYRELVPGADVVLLGDGIGHYPQVEDPDAVLAAYQEFLARVASH